jgi:DNA-binding NarL/FixJ family response regulator
VGCGLSIFVVEDDGRCRSLIATILGQVGFRTRAFADGEAALAAMRDEVPDAVLLDVGLPRLSGYEICQRIRLEFGQSVPVVFVSGERMAPHDVSAGFSFGADDYIIKPFAPEELLARLRRLVRAQSDPAAASPLSKRELQVLRLLADGLEQREIAKELFISVKTVGTHIEHILSKMGVHSRTQAVAQAYRRGLLPGGGQRRLSA